MGKQSIFEKPMLLDGLGLLFFFVFLGIVPPFASDPGVGWHLKTGQWIVENFRVPHHDPFLWSSEGREWISNQWLSDIILWGIFKTGGFDALAIFCFALPLTTMIWVQGKILISIKQNNSEPQQNEESNTFHGLIFYKLKSLIVPSILSFSVFVAWIQWIVRPVVFSFVLFSILFYWIWKAHNLVKFPNGRFYFAVAALFVLWANLHSAFPLGLLMLAFSAFAALVEKNYARFRLFLSSTLIGLLATFINPYGYKLHGNIISLLGEPYFMSLNSEWLSPNFGDLIFLPLALAIGLMIFASSSAQVSKPLWIRFITVAFCILALRGVRYIPFLGLILPTILMPANQQPSSRKHLFEVSKFCPILLVLFSSTIFIISLFTSIDSSGKYTSQLLRETKMWELVSSSCERADGKIYNHPDLGGGITFLLHPNCRASIDDRNELNGVESYKDFFKAMRADPSIDLAQLPKAMLIECNSPLASLAKEGYQGLKSVGDFERFCLIERG